MTRRWKPAPPRPYPALGNNLANFLAARLSGSFGNLNCQNFGLTNPVTLTVDGNGVATGARSCGLTRGSWHVITAGADTHGPPEHAAE